MNKNKNIDPEDDIRDSKSDRERLNADESTFMLPDVNDIPGQEHVHLPDMGELADTTISSADEDGLPSGDEQPDDDEETKIVMGTDADIPADDRIALERADNYMPLKDDERLQEAALDDTDEDGDPLEEESFGRDNSGGGLDVPGSELDDDNEELGEEDEENNYYSLGSDDNDNNENRTDGIP